MKVSDLTLQAVSDRQTVLAAAVSSLTFKLTSCRLNFDENKIVSKDPVAGIDDCETVAFVTFPHPACISVMTNCRSRRDDETDTCIVHAAEADSLICTEESDNHTDDGATEHRKEARVEMSLVPSNNPETVSMPPPVVDKLTLLKNATAIVKFIESVIKFWGPSSDEIKYIFFKRLPHLMRTDESENHRVDSPDVAEILKLFERRAFLKSNPAKVKIVLEDPIRN